MSHWLSEDGQRAMVIIEPIEWTDDDGDKCRIVANDLDWVESWHEVVGWTPIAHHDKHTMSCILDHHAEKWLHERMIVVGFQLKERVWMSTSFRMGVATIGPFKDKSQALIAAVLAAKALDKAR